MVTPTAERLFVVMTLSRSVDVNVFGAVHSVPLIYADGMVGALPVFGTRPDAEKAAAGVYTIVEIELTNLAKDQEPLGAEFEAVWDAHIEELYEH